jgi:hypothetical protein
MSIRELEEAAGIRDEDKTECPYQGDRGCDNCTLHLNQETCEEMYIEYLEQKIAES